MSHPKDTCPECGGPKQTRSRTCHHCWVTSLKCTTTLTTMPGMMHDIVDEVAVERLIAGNPPPHTTRAERQTAVTYLTNHKLSAIIIAQRIKVTPRTVVRLRAKARAS